MENNCDLQSKAPFEIGGDKTDAKIILIGEDHGIDWVIEKELDIWNCYYSNEKLRNYFIEVPYYTAQFLNLWIKSTNNELLDQYFYDIKGTAMDKQIYYNYFSKIKQECPETVFHGVDVGHQYKTIGERFVKYSIENNLQNTEQYNLALETIEQGKYFYETYSHEYRENMMSQNFIRQFDNVGKKKIIGFFGYVHTSFNNNGYDGNYPSLAEQLRKYYGNIIYFENYLDK